MELLLESPGLRLQRRDGCFLIEREGQPSLKLAPAQVTQILAGRGILLSSGAIRLAAESGIPLMLVDGQGQPSARLWSPHYGSIATIRRGQVYFAEGMAGRAWVAGIIAKRLRGSARLLAEQAPEEDPVCLTAMETLHRQADRIEQHIETEGDWRARLRGEEGSAMRTYFAGLPRLLPAGWAFEGRSRRPARDPFNCLLNYLYGMLYSYLEGDLIRAGIDPYLGVLHQDEYQRPVLVFDLIEAYRTWVERVALKVACEHMDPPVDWFQVREGGWWLLPPGKKVIITALQAYLSAATDSKRGSRRQRMQAACHALARRMTRARPDG